MVNRQNPRRRLRRRLIENKRAKDVISSLPDDILLHILSFTPTKFAIRTSLLSKRWRYIWCDTPSLYFDNCTQRPASIIETQMHYRAPKVNHFRLKTNLQNKVNFIKSWVKYAMSPSSNMVHGCSVSWPSLKKLSLRWCGFPNESIAKLLSGCPNLECLTLYCCKGLGFLDLSKNFHLRTLEINSHVESSTNIVAPHIHCLRLINSQLPCTLVNVSSLTEAKLDICIRSRDRIFKDDFLQAMVLGMLDKLQHVEKLTFGGNFLQILSLAEVRGVHFPMLEVKTLILETVIFQCVVPGIERLLQNSPDLKKLMTELLAGSGSWRNMGKPFGKQSLALFRVLVSKQNVPNCSVENPK
ncbi:PREDICTED: putative F-box/LRR-repeat protein At3g18150 [Camelina sativa]|uniref:F-box/LRR-repeat protein At3g18150 n=1 Tax=Camelina sativa TaxID=90675 RepID=A0ABM1RPG9_CAMSA|nr:PREDICTED: putative F-box/LRR-repeat protein At3g18150 [Camelina sativa]